MKHLPILLVGMLLLYTLSISAQVSVQGTPPSFEQNAMQTPPVEDMPYFDLQRLLGEDAEAENKGGTPPRFGQKNKVQFNTRNSGIWETMPNGDRLWRLSIRSDNAYSLNFTFSKFKMPKGAKLYIYNQDHSSILGAFTSINNKAHGKFSTSPIKGDIATFEYYEPKSMKGRGLLEINEVVHAYRNLFETATEVALRGFGDSGACNNDVACPEGNAWNDQIRSVVLTIVNGNRNCSGAMVNNTAQDGTPYFLSANHCGSTGIDTWVFVFNYNSPSCGGGDGSLNQSISGGVLRANNDNSDFALLELSTPPPPNYVVYYSGWNRTTTAATSSVGIHHPAGDVKKITFNTDPLVNGINDNYWQVTEWEDGTTEGGSSGSPLFDANKRIVGQLFGGSASCTSITEDIYGKFDRSWDVGTTAGSRLKEWLDPHNTGLLFLDGAYFLEPPLAYNMKMEAINSPNSTIPVCITNPTPEIVVRNIGGSEVTTFNIVYSYDEADSQTYTWTGTLGFYQKTTVTLPATDLSVGNHNLVATVAMPNGNSDLDLSNNELIMNFNIIDGNTATMNLTTDQYPTENTVTILDEAGNVVYIREEFTGNSLNTEDFCLEDGCYRFVITDSYGDGLLDGANLEFAVDGQSIGQISGDFTSDTLYACLPFGLQADFLIPNQAYCVGESITPKNISQQAIAWAWIMPNANIESSTLENPNFSYDTPGTYTINLTVIDAEGNNDVFTTNVTVITGELLTIDLLTDRWPDENSYEVLNSEGDTIFSSRGFSEGDINMHLIQNICLEDGCYTIVFSDAYGDGLGGGQNSPSGSFTVSVGEEVVGFTEGDFGAIYEVSFCLPLEVNVTETPLSQKTILSPNPTQGFIQIQSPELPQYIEVRDVLGRLVSTVNLPSSNSLNISHVDAGIYFIRMTFRDGMVTKRVVKH